MYDFNEYDDLDFYRSGTSEYDTNFGDEYAYATHEYSSGQSDLEQTFEFEETESSSDRENDPSEKTQRSPLRKSGYDAAQKLRQQASRLKQSVHGMARIVTMTVAVTATVATVSVASGGTFLPQVSQYVEQVAELMNEPVVSPREGLDFNEFLAQLAGLEEADTEAAAEKAAQAVTTAEETTLAAAEAGQEPIKETTAEGITQEETTAPETSPVEETTAPPETSPVEETTAPAGTGTSPEATTAVEPSTGHDDPDPTTAAPTTAAPTTAAPTTAAPTTAAPTTAAPTTAAPTTAAPTTAAPTTAAPTTAAPTTPPETTTAAVQYTITFKNDDGTVLDTQLLVAGATPSYSGATPTKAASGGNTYLFKEWVPDITAVTGDAEYTAAYHQFGGAVADKTTYMDKCSIIKAEVAADNTIEVYQCAECGEYFTSTSGAEKVQVAFFDLFQAGLCHYGAISVKSRTSTAITYTCSECGDHTVMLSSDNLSSGASSYYEFTLGTDNYEACIWATNDSDQMGVFSDEACTTLACELNGYYLEYPTCYFSSLPGTLYFPCRIMTVQGGNPAFVNIGPFAFTPAEFDLSTYTACSHSKTAVTSTIGCQQPVSDLVGYSKYYCATCGYYVKSSASGYLLTEEKQLVEGIMKHGSVPVVQGSPAGTSADPGTETDPVHLHCSDCRSCDADFTVNIVGTEYTTDNILQITVASSATNDSDRYYNSAQADELYYLDAGGTLTDIPMNSGYPNPNAGGSADTGVITEYSFADVAAVKLLEKLYVLIYVRYDDGAGGYENRELLYCIDNPLYQKTGDLTGGGLLGSAAPSATPSDVTRPNQGSSDAASPSGDMPLGSSGPAPYLPVSSGSAADTSGSSDSTGRDDDDSGDS